MRYDTLQNEMVNHTKAVFDTAFGLNAVDVVNLPEKEEDYARPFARAQVTISFAGSQFPAVQSTNQVSQHETVKFEVTVKSRTLYGITGIHTLLEATKIALAGFQTSQTNRLKPTAINWVSWGNGIWEYLLEYEAQTLLVQVDDTPPAQLITQIIANAPTIIL